MAMRYREFVIRGPHGWTLGYLRGFLAARDRGGQILDAEACGFDCAPARERLREKLGLGSETLHLLVPEALAPDVRAAVAAAPDDRGPVSLVAEEPVRGARFAFSFSIYSKDHARRVRRLFEDLPEEVELSADSRFEERRDPDARGAEAYTPAHEYELRARGTVEGSVDGVLAVHRACSAQELVRVSRLEAVHEPPARPEP